MKSSLTPTLCGLALVAAVAAGLSHWHSTEQLVQFAASGLPVSAGKQEVRENPKPALKQSDSGKIDRVAGIPIKPDGNALPDAPASPAKQEFYEALLTRMEALQSQNRDLLDQLAETNRDLMKLEFRVDTHSESFRPLPVSEERWDTTIDAGPGVLPPRAEPISLPSYE